MPNPQYDKFIKMITQRPARCLWQVNGPPMHGLPPRGAPFVGRGSRGPGVSKLEAWMIAGQSHIILVHAFPHEGIDLYLNNTPSEWPEIEKLLGPTDEERRAAAEAAP
jgi:hypothetical protein